MALTKCPECEHQVSTAATSCPNCGHPLSVMAHQDPITPSRSGPPVSGSCPKCGLIDQVQRVSTILDTGTGTTASTGTGAGFSSDGEMVGMMTSSSGTYRSGLAASLKVEPDPDEPLTPGWLAIVFLFTFWTIIGGIGVLASMATYPARRKQFDETRARQARLSRERGRLSYCFRDDLLFDPETGRYSNRSNLVWLLTDPENCAECGKQASSAEWRSFGKTICGVKFLCPTGHSWVREADRGIRVAGFQGGIGTAAPRASMPRNPPPPPPPR